MKAEVLTQQLLHGLPPFSLVWGVSLDRQGGGVLG